MKRKREIVPIQELEVTKSYNYIEDRFIDEWIEHENDTHVVVCCLKEFENLTCKELVTGWIDAGIDCVEELDLAEWIDIDLLYKETHKDGWNPDAKPVYTVKRKHKQILNPGDKNLLYRVQLPKKKEKIGRYLTDS